jgi:ribosomal protein L37AE/L43A
MCKPIRPFIVQAEQFRRRRLVGLALGLAGAVLLAVNTVAPAMYVRAIGVPAVLLAGLGALLLNASPILRCPTCTGLAEELDRYCPVCGADGLERKPLAAPHCTSCDRTLARYWIRDYPIRHCTHCGVGLSSEGV